jgi:hypothetical protein
MALGMLSYPYGTETYFTLRHQAYGHAAHR